VAAAGVGAVAEQDRFPRGPQLGQRFSRWLRLELGPKAARELLPRDRLEVARHDPAPLAPATEVGVQQPDARRQALAPSGTATLPLRADDFDRCEFETELRLRFGLARDQCEHLVRTYGGEAEVLLRNAPPELRRPIGRSRFSMAEIPWCFETECPATLCDLLEHRIRVAIFAEGQGLPELASIASTAARAAGWDAAQERAEALAYAAAVRRRYQIVAPSERRHAA